MAPVRRQTPLALAAPSDTLAQAPAISAERRLRDLGIVLPEVQAPVANDVPHARMGTLVFLPGVGPLRPDGTRPGRRARTSRWKRLTGTRG